MTNFCYEFGRAVAQFQRDDFDMSTFHQLCIDVGLLSSCGSNGERDAMIGAFDEYKRLKSISSNEHEST